MLLAVAVLVLLISLLVALLRWRWQHFSYFKRLGIPGPKPNLIWGNIREFHSMPHYKVVEKWFKEYGDMVGFYNGDVPFVATKNLEFIEFICVRNFNNFADRGTLMITQDAHPILGRSLINVGTPFWKRIRASVVHGFSAAKLKLVMPSFEEECGVLLKSLEKHTNSGEEVNMHEVYEQLSMEYVTKSLFGLDEHFFGNANHPLYELVSSVFRSFMTGPLHMLGQSTTAFGSLMTPVFCLANLLWKFPFGTLTDETAKIVELRRKDPSLRRPDMLQNLLDVELSDEDLGFDDSGDKKGVPPPRALTAKEVALNAAALFVAGYETTSTSLCYITFVLAKYPDVQEKVRQEVFDALSRKGSLDYDTVTKKFTYLGQVLDETLRIYSPALTSISRKALEDFEFDGIKYKAGTCFLIPQYHLQLDERFWPAPFEFDPDRFSRENAPSLYNGAHLPFGIGPRNCVGKQMATFEVKYTAARLVQNFRMELGPSQKAVAVVGVFCSCPALCLAVTRTRHRPKVADALEDLKPAATGLIGAGGYGGYGSLGQGVNNFQSGYGNAGYGKGFGGYSNYGNNKALAGGSFGKGSFGDNAISAYGNQGLGQGGINNLAAHGLHGVSGATGYNHQGGVNKQFAGKGGARDQFNAGHNKVFAKEKVYAVDQSFQNGNRDAFNHGYGAEGGFTGQGGFGKQDKINQFGNQQYGAFKGYGQGNYGKHGRSTFGDGVQGINNYGHAAGYGTQAQQGKGYGGYGHGNVGAFGGALNHGYGGYGATQAVAPFIGGPVAHGVGPALGYGHGIGHHGLGVAPHYY